MEVVPSLQMSNDVHIADMNNDKRPELISVAQTDGVAFAAPQLVVRGANIHVVDVDDALDGLWIHNGAPSLGTNETESAAAIRARLSGRCRADRDEACENCYSSHVSTLCPFSLTARAAAVETGVELVLAPTNGEALRWVLPRHARPPWRLPQHAPL